jgi:putative phosphoribosyl transferase
LSTPRGDVPVAYELALALPIAAPETYQALQPEVDEMICAVTPKPFYGVSHWYEIFSQGINEEVCILLQEANQQLFYG